MNHKMLFGNQLCGWIKVLNFSRYSDYLLQKSVVSLVITRDVRISTMFIRSVYNSSHSCLRVISHE